MKLKEKSQKRWIPYPKQQVIGQEEKDFKLYQGIFSLGIRNNLFTERVLKH